MLSDQGRPSTGLDLNGLIVRLGDRNLSQTLQVASECGGGWSAEDTVVLILSVPKRGEISIMSAEKWTKRPEVPVVKDDGFLGCAHLAFEEVKVLSCPH